MALSPRLEIRQHQTLVMTPQLQQAIKLLQMSHLELSAFVAAEIEKNPLLELAPPAAPAGGSVAPARRGEGTGDFLESVAAEVSLHDHLHAQIGAMRGRPDAIEAAMLLADELEDEIALVRSRVEESRAATTSALHGNGSTSWNGAAAEEDDDLETLELPENGDEQLGDIAAAAVAALEEQDGEDQGAEVEAAPEPEEVDLGEVEEASSLDAVIARP